MKQRLKNTGLVLAILPLGLIGMGGLFVGMWFLGDWLYTTPAWWLGIPVRIFQWIVAAGIFGFVIYWVYLFFKTLITGKEIEP